MADIIERAESGGISYVRSGAGRGPRPLVLLHGIGSYAQSFAGLMSALPARETIAWDAPGYGASEPLEGDWPSQDDYAACLAALLDRLAIGEIDLLGHSLGTLVAARFAIRNPARVNSLVLASAALGYGTKPGQPLAPATGNRLEAFIAEGGRQFASTRGPRLVYARDDARLVAQVVKAMSEVKLPGYAQASRMLSCGDLIADAKRIATRTLVLVGEQDDVTPPANCRRLFDAMNAATPSLGHFWETIDCAGHAVPQERPAEVAAAIEAFLSASGKKGEV